MAARGKANNQYGGGKWIRTDKRLAIYLRDGLACAYCGETLEQTALSLDHLRPHSDGVDNSPANLVTACKRCNSSRGNRDWREFALKVAGYLNHDATAEGIVERITELTARPLDMAAARQIIANRK